MNLAYHPMNKLHELSISTCLHGLLCLICIAGCGDPVGAPVNVNVAQQTLASVMESWKEGKSPQDLMNESPSIFVQEMEWTEGTTLVDYEILGDDQPTGPNLTATVKLKLSKADGKVTEKTATYIVGTSPSRTVYRNTMR